MPHRWRVLAVDLLVLPPVASAGLFAASIGLRVTTLLDSIVGAVVVFFLARAFALRQGWPERGVRRVSVGAAVLTFFMPALFWLIILALFVIGCHNGCFTF